MSADSFRRSLAFARETLELAGIPSLRVGDAIASRILDGEDPTDVGRDYGTTAEDTLHVAVAVLACDRRRHGLTAAQAARIEQEEAS